MTRKALDPHAVKLKDLEHALSRDPDRPTLATHCAFERNGYGYIAATDGHRASALRSERWREYVRKDAPPVAQVIPWDAPLLGEFDSRDLAESRCFPAAWQVIITIGDCDPVISVQVMRGKDRFRHPVGRGDITPGWGPRLERATHVRHFELKYLADAVNFQTSARVRVWGHPNRQSSWGDILEPIAVTSDAAESISDAHRVAVVMPFRK